MINFEGRAEEEKKRQDFGSQKIDLRPCNQTSQAARINHHHGRSSHAGHLLVPQIKKEVSELSDAIRAGPPHTQMEGPETRQTVRERCPPSTKIFIEGALDD